MVSPFHGNKPSDQVSISCIEIPDDVFGLVTAIYNIWGVAVGILLQDIIEHQHIL